MDTADLLAYVRAVGESGGTLTLEYDIGEITLTGAELIEAVEDYSLTDPFSIAGNED